MRRALDVSIPYLYPHGDALLRARTFLPPEAHEGTVGDQTLRDIKVEAMGEGTG